MNEQRCSENIFYIKVTETDWNESLFLRPENLGILVAGSELQASLESLRAVSDFNVVRLRASNQKHERYFSTWSPLFSLSFPSPLTPFPIGRVSLFLSTTYMSPPSPLSFYHLVSSFRAPQALTSHSPSQMPLYKLLFSRTVSAKRRNVSRKGVCSVKLSLRGSMPANLWDAYNASQEYCCPHLSLQCLPLFYLWPPAANHPPPIIPLFWSATFCTDYSVRYWNVLSKEDIFNKVNYRNT